MTAHLAPAFALSAAVTALALAAAPAAAQQRVGGFSGTLDGEPREWHILDLRGQTSAGWYDNGGMAQVEVFGFPRPDSATDAVGGLEFSITLMGAGLVPMGASMTYYADGTRQLYLNVEEEPEVRITSARVEGRQLHLSGEISGEVFRVIHLFREEVDEDDSRAITARFDLVLDVR